MDNYNQNAQYGANQESVYQPPTQYQAGQWPHMTMGNWLVCMLLMLVPVANIVLMFLWAFGGNVNPSKKSFYQAALIMAAIGIGVFVILGGAILTLVLTLVNSMS